MIATKRFPSGSPAEIAHRPRLLLVEDDLDLARALVRSLSQMALEIVHATDGLVASEALKDSAFDLVLSDISLPKITGVDLLRIVRAYDLDVPVILMTGDPRLDTAIQAVELGALQYITKPVPVEELRATISRGLVLGQLARAKRDALAMVAEGSKRIGDRAGLTVRFERALEGLHLAFQPIVDIRSKTTFGYEVLLRSREPSLPDPAAVLGAAERLDAIHHLGRRVRSLAAVAIDVLPSPDTLLFVNLHSAELNDPELYTTSGPLAPHARRVVLEVTERASLDGVRDVPSRMRRLRELGFRLALDDLGAGYAGLASFTALEPELVKLDMSLVRGIGDSVTKQRVVGSFVRLCRELSVGLIAEGVETREELSVIADLGCNLVQGYYLGRPTDAPAAVTTLT